MNHDPVNHPAHYTQGGIEVINAIRAWGLDCDHCLASAVAYIARAGKKDPAKFCEDLEKAIWYLRKRLEWEKARVEPSKSKPVTTNDLPDPESPSQRYWIPPGAVRE